jgi:hypothetical protein
MPSRGAHQVHGGDAAGIEPVAGEVERRAVAVLQPEHVAIEVLGAFQIGRFDRVMLQDAERHRVFLLKTQDGDEVGISVHSQPRFDQTRPAQECYAAAAASGTPRKRKVHLQ